jgi:prepilin-type N-terminal cleavage/methylation domain-containing protein
MLSHRLRPLACRRRAFTLVEILVVVAIIGVLAALTAGATIQIIGYQRSSNTESTIRTLTTVLNRQWKAVSEQADLETPPGTVLQGLASNDSARAKVIWRKLRLAQEFPMNFSEVLGPNPAFQYVGPKQTYVKALQALMITGGQSPPQIALPSAPNSAAESAVCLYLALQVSRKGIAVNTDLLPSGSVADKQYIDPSSKNVIMTKQYVDAWGYPLVLYRWPTGTANGELNTLNPAAPGAAPGTTIGDPDDPTGLLMNLTWWNYTPPTGPAPRPLFEQICHSVSTPVGSGSAPAPASYYMTPVIVSAGKNNILGLARVPSTNPDPMAPDGTDDSFDNIYSFRLRVGQRGD